MCEMSGEKRTLHRHGTTRISDAELKARSAALQKLGGKGAKVVFGFFECVIDSDELNARGEVRIAPPNNPNRNAKRKPDTSGFRGQYVNPAQLRASRRG